jgi:hypothetical protein
MWGSPASPQQVAVTHLWPPRLPLCVIRVLPFASLVTRAARRGACRRARARVGPAPPQQATGSKPCGTARLHAARPAAACGGGGGGGARRICIHTSALGHAARQPPPGARLLLGGAHMGRERRVGTRGRAWAWHAAPRRAAPRRAAPRTSRPLSRSAARGRRRRHMAAAAAAACEERTRALSNGRKWRMRPCQSAGGGGRKEEAGRGERCQN